MNNLLLKKFCAPGLHPEGWSPMFALLLYLIFEKLIYVQNLQNFPCFTPRPQEPMVAE